MVARPTELTLTSTDWLGFSSFAVTLKALGCESAFVLLQESFGMIEVRLPHEYSRDTSEVNELGIGSGREDRRPSEWDVLLGLRRDDVADFDGQAECYRLGTVRVCDRLFAELESVVWQSGRLSHDFGAKRRATIQ